MTYKSSDGDMMEENDNLPIKILLYSRMIDLHQNKKQTKNGELWLKR